MSSAVVRINVTEDIRQEFQKQFASQSDVDTLKGFAAKVVRDGLERLNQNGNPPGDEPRKIPTAQGGNKGIEFSRPDNRDLVEELKKFREKHRYMQLPIAQRACLYAGLNIPQPWS